MVDKDNYQELVKILEVEIATWKLAAAKREINQWGNGYIRGLELAKEWVNEAALGDLSKQQSLNKRT